MTDLRPQCPGCPWRDMVTMREQMPAIVAHAEGQPDGFVCHERMGPCDGPRHAARLSARPPRPKATL